MVNRGFSIIHTVGKIGLFVKLKFENMEDKRDHLLQYEFEVLWQMSICININSALDYFQLIFIISCTKMPIL